MTIIKRFLLAFGAVFACLCASLALSAWDMQKMDRRLRTSTDHTARKLDLTGVVNTAESDMLVAQRGLELGAFAKDDAAMARARSDFETAIKTVRAGLKEIAPLLMSERGKQIVREMESAVDTWATDYQEVERLSQSGDALGSYRFGIQKTHSLHEKLSSLATELTEQQRQFLKDEKEAAAQDTSRASFVMITMSILSMAIAAGAVLLVRSLQSDMRHVTTSLRDASAQVSQSSTQVSQASQQLAEAASQQAASIEETSAAAEEITSMTVKNADNTASVASLTGELSDSASKANETLGAMIQSMQEISASSNQIGQIIKVIDEIAFQTNILALNAAVEAARAGEAGKGFAVVADEVRKLAQRAAQAAKDTAELIQQSIQRSGEGKQNLDGVTESIRSITQGIVKVRELGDEVNVASQEQQRGIRQISTTINEMNSVTQTVAANSEQSAASSQELNAMAASLVAVVEELERMVGKSDQVRSFDAAGLAKSAKPAHQIKAVHLKGHLAEHHHA